MSIVQDKHILSAIGVFCEYHRAPVCIISFLSFSDPGGGPAEAVLQPSGGEEAGK